MLDAGRAGTYRSLEMGRRHGRIDIQPFTGRRPTPQTLNAKTLTQSHQAQSKALAPLLWPQDRCSGFGALRRGLGSGIFRVQDYRFVFFLVVFSVEGVQVQQYGRGTIEQGNRNNL